MRDTYRGMNEVTDMKGQVKKKYIGLSIGLGITGG